ncbi:hypothetical protein BST81_05770 [Leptolyngbya sp. 'hensonii']|nr:hypothetical protein BST81_05770 [Leptolyngbya sp. 'hensonii']
MLHLLHTLLHLIQSVLVPFCLVMAWVFSLLLTWSLVAATKNGIAQARKLHQIPCAHCQFFTRDYRLKCTVHPTTALSEAAIGCLDYQPETSLYYAGSQAERLS